MLKHISRSIIITTQPIIFPLKPSQPLLRLLGFTVPCAVIASLQRHNRVKTCRDSKWLWWKQPIEQEHFHSVACSEKLKAVGLMWLTPQLWISSSQVKNVLIFKPIPPPLAVVRDQFSQNEYAVYHKCRQFLLRSMTCLPSFSFLDSIPCDNLLSII